MANEPIPGSYRERVDKAGGIEAYKLQQAKAFMEEASKIKPEQWKGINSVLDKVKGFIDIDAGSIFSDVKDGIVDTLILKKDELFAPIRNEINGLINTAIEPLIPAIEWIVNNIILPAIQGLVIFIEGFFTVLATGTNTEHPDVPGSPGETIPSDVYEGMPQHVIDTIEEALASLRPQRRKGGIQQ